MSRKRCGTLVFVVVLLVVVVVVVVVDVVVIVVVVGGRCLQPGQKRSTVVLGEEQHEKT